MVSFRSSRGRMERRLRHAVAAVCATSAMLLAMVADAQDSGIKWRASVQLLSGSNMCSARISEVKETGKTLSLTIAGSNFDLWTVALKADGSAEADISFPVSPIRDHVFLSRRSSSACSATTSFSARASRRRSITSLLVAARAVSPASRRLPASRNSFDQL